MDEGSFCFVKSYPRGYYVFVTRVKKYAMSYENGLHYVIITTVSEGGLYRLQGVCYKLS